MNKSTIPVVLIVLLSVMNFFSVSQVQALEFPVMKTAAKPGEYVLAPGEKAEDITPDNAAIFYAYTMITPGDGESTIKSSFDEWTTPNALIIPIPAGQTAKVGDVVLTWWQSGSGMRRALVVNAKNPKEPVIKYLEDGIGDEEEQLKPDSFVKLTEELAPGTLIAIKDEDWGEYAHKQVVNVVGDKVVVLGWGSTLSIHDKVDCLPLPLLPKVKPGDEIYVKFTSFLSETATVKKVNKQAGWVATESGDMIAFGEFLYPVKLIQAFLTRLGYNPGPIDGAMGKKTAAAIQTFQKDMNLSEDGKPTLQLMETLHSKVKEL